MVVSLVHELPSEILTQIFLQCATEKLQVPWAIMQMPWVLSHICSRWRELALTITELWNDLHIDCMDTWQASSERSDRLCDMAEELFSRSGKAFLSLAIAWVAPHHLRALLPHFHRVQHLDVFKVTDSFSAALPDSLPFLESIRVGAPHSGKFSFAALRMVPNLRIVRLHCLPDAYATQPVLLPLSQLTVIDFQSSFLRVHDSLGLLTQCRCLVECSLLIIPDPSNYYFTTPSTWQTPDHHTLPFLRSLLVGVREASVDLTPFGKILRLPRLCRFELVGQTKGVEWLLPIATNSGCLESFILRDLSISPHILEPILEGSPGLQTLVIAKGGMLSPPLLSRIGAGSLIPRLETLHCVIHTDDNFPAKTMLDLHLDMLERRRCMDNFRMCITDVIFTASPQVVLFASNHKFSRLHKLRSEGCSIKLDLSLGFG